MSEPINDATARQLMLLGEIKGIVQGLKDSQDGTNRRLDSLEKRQDTRFDAIDTRLRRVEQKAAVIGAASGGVMAVGTALIIESIKAWLGRHGG